MQVTHVVRLSILALLLLSGLPATSHALSPIPTYPHLICDSEKVFADSTDNIAIFVHPTYEDDTENIQCALDEAVRMGVPVVQLISADYTIRSLAIQGFNGTLQGTSKTGTVVSVLDRSIDCSAFIEANRIPAAIKFIGGEPRIRYLKLAAGPACDDEWELVAILHFTGAAASDTLCENDVVFGTVDRVIIDGGSRLTGPRIAISAQSEAYQLHPLLPAACNRNLLGTFKLNRSDLLNTQFGVVTSMRSNAQVDINFNTFEGNDASVWIENANQNTSVTKNTFMGLLSAGNFYAGVVQTVYLEGGDTPPKTSRLVINENEFDLTPFADEDVYGVALSGRQATDISAVITRNAFQLSAAVYAGISTSDVSNGHVSANRFTGDEADYFVVEALSLNDMGTSTTTGWTVSGNDFSQFNATFYTNTAGNYFGPDQAAGIFDAGTGNIVIENGNYPYIIDLQAQLNHARTADRKSGSELTLKSSAPAIRNITSAMSARR